MVKKMKNFKIVLSVFLSVCLVLTSVQFVPLETAEAQEVKDTNISYSNNEIARYNDYPVYKYENVFYKPEYQYYNVQYGTNYGDYYYSDGYFAEDAETSDNEHLYTTSLHFAVAAFSSDYDMNNDSAKNYNNSPKRVLSFLSKTGFQNGKVNSDYYIKPTKDTIGVAAGYRYVKEGDYYVIAAAVRGGDYEAEWVSNLTMGTSGDAQGFNTAASKVDTFIEQYRSENNIPKEKLKVWITGYSRGAAVANIEAKNLSEVYGKSNVFGYCLACPQPALGNGNTYNNIKNVVYDDDLVPRVAPDYMNFTRYGQTKTYSNSTTDMTKYKAELAKFSNITIDDNFEQATFHVLNSVINGSGFTPSVTGSTMKQSEYLDELILRLKNWGIIPSREAYATNKIEGAATYEDTFGVLFELMQNSSNTNLINSLTSSFSGLDGGKYYTLYRMVTKGSESMPFEDNNFLGMTTLFSNGRRSVYDAIWSNFNNNGGTSGMTTEQISELKRVWYAVCRLAIDFIYNDSGGGGNATFLGTYMYNANRIDADHYPQKYLTFLRMDDSYYQNSDATISYVSNNSSYSPQSQKSRIGTTAVGARTIDNERFEGWYLDKECTEPYDHKTYVVTGNLTLYGKWKQYTNEYNWGTDSPSEQVIPKNDTQYSSQDLAKQAVDQNFRKGTTVVGTKDGKFGTWTFSGWDSGTFNASSLTTTYTGSWTFSVDSYTVVYRWGNDSPSDESLPVDSNTYNTEAEAKASVDTKYTSPYKKDGTKGDRAGMWTFTGWDTGSVNNVTKVVTFTGSWTFSTDPLDFTVAFVIDGQAGFETKTIREGTTIDLSTYTPEAREGYYFDGWYTDTAMTRKAANEQVINNHIVFTARWVKQSTVVYVWGDSAPEGRELPVDTTIYNTEELAKAAVNKDYPANFEVAGNVDGVAGTWIFSGWDEGSVEAETKVITFTGSWKFVKDRYVTLKIEGQDSVDVKTVRDGSAFNLDENLPSEQSDKLFNGWYKDAELTQKVTDVTVNTDLVFYGQWKNKYTLKYEWGTDVPEGQTLPSDSSFYSTSEDAKNAVDTTFTRDYTIDGQKDGEQGTWKFTGWVSSEIDHSSNVITYKGTWEFTKQVKTYDLVLETGEEGITAEEKTLTFQEGTTVSLGRLSPEREGYAFTGWYKDASYSKDSGVVEVKMEENTTLYAEWVESNTTHYLTLIINDTTTKKVTYPKGTVWSATSYTPSRDGYTFGGWYTDETYENKVTSLTLNADTKLYAKWNENQSSSNPDGTVTEPKINVKTYTGNGTLLVNGTAVKEGDNLDYTPGQGITITWQPGASGDNVTFIKSLKLNGTDMMATSEINKSQWLITNSAYKNKMGQNAQMVTYDAVINTEQTLNFGTANDVTTQTLEVEFDEYMPVYRLYNSITSEHLFTTNKAEYDGWVEKCNRNEDFWIGEGIDWFAPVSGTQVYRLYNAALGASGQSSHYYTSDIDEINNLVSNHGWVQEEASYGFMSGGTTAIYTCYNEGLGSAHHYTSSKTEWENLANHGWALEEDKNIANNKNGVFQAAMSAK